MAECGCRSGLTLIEIMVVIAILGMMAVALSVGLGGKLTKANQEMARLQIRELRDHVELYRQTSKRLPASGEGLQEGFGHRKDLATH